MVSKCCYVDVQHITSREPQGGSPQGRGEMLRERVIGNKRAEASPARSKGDLRLFVLRVMSQATSQRFREIKT